MPDHPVTIVRACLRSGESGSGSPTAVLDELPLPDDDRRRLPAQLGVSHAVFVSAGASAVGLRFFTADGELPACGHGTVAALAYLAVRAGSAEYRATLRTPARTFTAGARLDGARVAASFDAGPVGLRAPDPGELEPALAALRITPDALAPGARVASIGRARLLVPVRTREALAALAPDLDGLRDVCDRLGLLGCYVHSAPAAGNGRIAARMFAPSIGVPEDIANANSTACLAAHLAGEGRTDIAVDMGDSLGSPATITAGVRQGPDGPVIHLGGAAEIAGVRPLP